MDLETHIASLKGTKGAVRKQLMADIAARPDFVDDLRTFLTRKNVALRSTLAKIIGTHVLGSTPRPGRYMHAPSEMGL